MVSYLTLTPRQQLSSPYVKGKTNWADIKARGFITQGVGENPPLPWIASRRMLIRGKPLPPLLDDHPGGPPMISYMYILFRLHNH